MTTNRCDKAEHLLDSIPKVNIDPDIMYPMLYMIQGKLDEAKKLQENKLFSSIHTALLALGTLSTIAERKNDFTYTTYLSDLHDRLIELFELRGAIGLDQKIRLLAKQGKIKEALDYFEIYIDRVIALNFDYSNHPLFSSIEYDLEKNQYEKVKHLMIKTLKKDENYTALQNEERFRKAIKKLKKVNKNSKFKNLCVKT